MKRSEKNHKDSSTGGCAWFSGMPGRAREDTKGRGSRKISYLATICVFDGAILAWRG